MYTLYSFYNILCITSYTLHFGIFSSLNQYTDHTRCIQCKLERGHQPTHCIYCKHTFSVLYIAFWHLHLPLINTMITQGECPQIHCIQCRQTGHMYIVDFVHSIRVAQVVQAFKPGCEDFFNLWWFLRIFVVSKDENEASHRKWKGCPQSSILNLQSSVLSPHSSVFSLQSSKMLPKT